MEICSSEVPGGAIIYYKFKENIKKLLSIMR